MAIPEHKVTAIVGTSGNGKTKLSLHPSHPLPIRRQRVKTPSSPSTSPPFQTDTTRYTFPHFVCLRSIPTATNICAKAIGLAPRIAAGFFFSISEKYRRQKEDHIPPPYPLHGNRYEEHLLPDFDDKMINYFDLTLALLRL